MDIRVFREAYLEDVIHPLIVALKFLRQLKREPCGMDFLPSDRF
jgi:hypothetical protein